MAETNPEKPEGEFVQKEEMVVQAPTRASIKEKLEQYAKKMKDSPKTCDLMERIQSMLNQYNGYPYASVSMLKSYDDKDTKGEHTSTLAKRIRFGYLMSGHTDVEKFIKAFVGAPIAYVQVHQEMPVLCDDGCYSAINVHGKPIKTFNVGEFVLTDPDSFVPFIVHKCGPNQFEKLEGETFHKITQAEADALLRMQQGEKVD